MLGHRFQSTRPMRGATKELNYGSYCRYISIHAPHAGRDGSDRSTISIHSNFNPRAPCGARHVYNAAHSQHIGISIHAPHAGRDYLDVLDSIVNVCISIHAPHAGRDL